MHVGGSFRSDYEEKENRPEAIDAILHDINDGLSKADRNKVFKGVHDAITAKPSLLNQVLQKFRISSAKVTTDLSNPDAVTDLLIKHKENWQIAPHAQAIRGAVTMGSRQVKKASAPEPKTTTDKVVETAQKITLPLAERFIKTKVPKELQQYAKVFDKELWELLADKPPVAAGKEIIVTGYVMGDGKGDWIAMCDMCKALKKEFPGNPIRLIAAANIAHTGKLEVPKGVTVNLEYFGNASLKPPDVAAAVFKDVDVHEKVREAGAVFYGPIEMPGLYTPVGAELANSGIRLQEYDGSTNFDELCGTEASLGFAEGNLGIFTKSSKKEYTFQELENSRLRGLLFGNEETPTKETVDAYQSKNDLYMCYTKSAKAVHLMMHAALYSCNRDKDVDICLPAKESVDFLVGKIDRSDLGKLGIGKVVLTNYDAAGNKVEKEIALSDSGRVMRVLDVGHLTRKDFKILTQISSPIVGCTGDSSLAQALSYGKIPFYELTDHKKGVATNLLKLVQEVFGKDSELGKYLHQAIYTRDEFNSPKIELTDEIIQQAKELGEYIRETPSARAYLKGAANECLMRAANPKLAQDIEKLRQQFLQQAPQCWSSEPHKRNLLAQAITELTKLLK